ncbi:uncharacterized protein LOC129058045 [Pongo abelii]|uniref:uncharacterized protein LOC129058045 n=1 Tax=Pongo abelii TaxID=9601 RepID=UPI00300619DB
MASGPSGEGLEEDLQHTLVAALKPSLFLKGSNLPSAKKLQEDVPPKLVRPSTPWDATEHPPASFFPSAHESWAAGGSSRRRIQRRELRPQRCTTPPHPRNKTCGGRLSTQLCTQPGAAPSPQKRWVDFVVISHPEGSRQPRRRASAQLLAPQVAPPAFPKAPRSLRSSGSLATLTDPSQYRRCLNRHPAPRLRLRLRLRPTGSSGSRSARQENPRRRPGGALKGPAASTAQRVGAVSLSTSIYLLKGHISLWSEDQEVKV